MLYLFFEKSHFKRENLKIQNFKCNNQINNQEFHKIW